MRHFRNHGITSDHRERQLKGSWAYEMTMLGYNYRLTDIQAALGMSQLKNVPQWTLRRQKIAERYQEEFQSMPWLTTLAVDPSATHAYHLFAILLKEETLRVGRDQIFKALRAENIGVNVHYMPVHLHPFYRERFGTKEGQCPVAEDAFSRMLSLPMFAAMTDADVDDVIRAVEKVCSHYAQPQ
jgi:perosamine synthetase